MAENEINEMDTVEEGKTLDITDKKCPNCGATVTYDPATLNMTCDFCGFSKTLPKPGEAGVVEEVDFHTAVQRQSQNWGTKKKSVVCQQCGGETIYDEADTAACCPFCGSTSVMPVDDDENVMAPGGVVPFEITKEKAAELFRNWMSHKWFAPDAAKKGCEAKNFNGLYLPYWTYDSQTTSSYSAKLGFEYKVKGPNNTTQTKIRWRNYSGIYDEFIDDMTVYASKKTTDANIKKVSIFDFKKLRPYAPEFIAGFAAERYTVGLDEGWNLAKVQIQQLLKDHLSSKLRSQYRADRVSEVRLSTTYDKITFKYLLAPIWLANFKFNDKTYNIAINGQTGKIAGKTPISPIKVGIAVVLAIIAIVVVFILLNN